MHASDHSYREVVETAFREAAFLSDLGIRLSDCGRGWCESALQLEPRHLQHTGLVHAGVQATIADHTAGTAAMTLIPPHEYVLTVEFKIHLLRPGKGDALHCRAQVLKPGKAFHVVEAEVYAREDDKSTLVSKLIATMAVLPRGSK